MTTERKPQAHKGRPFTEEHKVALKAAWAKKRALRLLALSALEATHDEATSLPGDVNSIHAADARRNSV